MKVLGFTGLPNAGDEFLVMESERSAKILSEERLAAKRTGKLSMPQRATLESLLEAADGKKVSAPRPEMRRARFARSARRVVRPNREQEDRPGDDSLRRRTDLGVRHPAGECVERRRRGLQRQGREQWPSARAKREGVQVKLYSIIYELIDQIKEAMAGLLDPEHRETVIGHAEVKQVFQLSRGIVAGCLVSDGRISRTARARVLRRRQPVYDGGLSTLRRFQDDVKEVRVGLECGIKLGDFSEYQVGDIIECYQLEQVAQKL